MGILLLQAVLRIPFLTEPLERDEGLYGYMAQRILAGEVPYRDSFDHKTPVIYYIYALIIKFFGGSIFSIRIFTLCYGLLTTLSIFFLVKLLWGEGVGLLSAFFFALFSGQPAVQGSNANTEVFMILPLILAFYLFILAKKDKNPQFFFGAGLLSGLAVMIKQSAGFNLLVLLGLAVFEGWGAVLLLLSGTAIFPLIFMVYFVLKGAFPQFLYCTILANITYLKAAPVPHFIFYPWYGLDIIAYMAFYENSILWIFSVAAVVYILFRDRNYQNQAVLFWTAFSFLGVAAGKLFFGHYFIQLLPALAALSAYAVFKVPVRIKWLLLAVAAILICPALIDKWPYYFKYTPANISQRKFGNIFWSKAVEVSDDMRKIVQPGDDIFVWDSHPEIYYYLEKKSPTYYVYYGNWMGEEPKPRIFKEVFSKRPKYILWVSYLNYDKPLLDFIKANYRLKKIYPVYKEINWGLFERTARF